MAKCKFCSKDISWLKEGRKFTPVEGDGTVHKCDEMMNSMKSIKSMERSSLSPEEIKKYEEAINKKKK
ncbi:hypothetical protein [Halobacteriovorax sp. JY17]|uniref:hypothetical protein n=1 Tax=Halobacteriovorax sp. JY17 TaxID=2014617 RepID=UPI000C368602|nr:hypothetical protein [Halobacteriovorax sp. JY17]PIK16357.1 MAG: hypothetical protein CES88_06340 [Halobacteriovorax sp. JY17]